jgi:putative ABC transport system permease protein
MRPVPVVRAARGGLSGRRLQAIVIGVVAGVSTAASVLALGLVIDSSGPFDRAFAAQHGADVTATVASAAHAQLAATTRLPGVTASAGPFPETSVGITAQVTPPAVSLDDRAKDMTPVAVRSQLTLAGRSSPGGPVDDLALTAGHWADGPGQIVISGQLGLPLALGSQITVSGVPGSPKLTVTGIATSITGTALGWVTPSEIASLHAAGAPEASQMLYRFSSASTAAQVSGDTAEITAVLPHGSVLGTQSWLAAREQATSSFAPWVPFIIAFGLIGLVMSVLIVINVVSGAVVSGTRRIGVLKSIGFTPRQVVAAYVLQVAVPAATGCVAGAVAGSLLAVPLLGQTAQVYGVGRLTMPFWVTLTVPLVMVGIVAGIALLISLRAGRMSAVQAITTSRAPLRKHGYGALRLLGRAPMLPRPVSIGLAGPFAQPARSLVTMVAVVFGVTAVIFGSGLGTSLERVQADLNRPVSEPVHIFIAGRQGPSALNGQAAAQVSPAAQDRAVQDALRAQPGTLHYVAEADGQASLFGLASQLSLIGFDGNASWTGYAMITGHWYSGPDQVDVNTLFLHDTGTAVGDDYTLTAGGKRITVRIAGEVFALAAGKPVMIGATSTLSAVDPALVTTHYDVTVAPGTDIASYASTLNATLGNGYFVAVNDNGGSVLPAMMALIGLLTLLIAVVAGLGVLNTVVLQTRERVHDLGVFKAVGMTPRQTIAMVVSTVTGIGLVAGLIAVPAGVMLHDYVVPAMGSAVQSGLPASVINVYQAPELILLALSGLVIAVAGALAPASWAARTRTGPALRAE